ncbi:putative Bifunctional inhibitor/lipid-transfer protein/seed storage 2S albumin superfamily protein [Hibiscus syriacus]|uniref:Bifunctional inhibitor/lipid-transfer protein/seed storage 2S albumin superfamily protein n=1 Tax=Hibiscus syriacus TaxID=106335 RepID=A0A6A3BBH7_HIBSY|nr:male-cone protein 1-like [Hibiscus syriacus]KAE8712189.1 putative Bifunctional inhibitor/lipid-transfer protein/seed storage 2S albumin superfamily protein [Hibiscus syriacus]
MASSSFGFLSLAMLVMVGTLWGEQDGVSAQCELSIPSLVSQCSEYVKISGPGIPPSKSCCDVVKGLNIPCMCKYVTPDVERLVSMEKVVFVAKSCGLTVQPGMKCGSFVVPPHA